MISSLLRQAIRNENPEEALRLLRSGENCPAIEKGRSNLQRAIKWCPDNLELIQELLKNRDVVNFVDRKDNTPMITAAHHANAAAIDLLVAANADVSGVDKAGRCPLYHAAIHSAYCLGGGKPAPFYAQTLDAMRTLVRHGAFATFQTATYPSILRSYLGAWCMTGDVQVVAFLVEEGAACPTEAYLQEVCRDDTEKVQAAIKGGLQGRALRAEERVTELRSMIPPPLVTLIYDYVY